jgi:c-di-GMP-binding flagellar brake protein YcgR
MAGMVRVGAGMRLVLRTASGAVTLRALRRADLSDRWELPVLGPADRVREGTSTLEVATPSGLVTLPVEVAVRDGALVLRGDPAGPPTLQQRREDVRGLVELRVRAAVLPGAPATGDDPAAARSSRARAADFDGVTASVSAGGAALLLSGGSPLPLAGDRLLLELDLPADAPGASGAPSCSGTAVVVATSGRPGETGLVHVRFLDLAPADRERLVRLVFAEERRRLAARWARPGGRSAVRSAARSAVRPTPGSVPSAGPHRPGRS